MMQGARLRQKASLHSIWLAWIDSNCFGKAIVELGHDKAELSMMFGFVLVSNQLAHECGLQLTLTEEKIFNTTGRISIIF